MITDAPAVVVGFIFNNFLDQVLLIEKQRPDWQAGRINGVGGKVERLETLEGAMARETFEEMGLVIAADDWKNFHNFYHHEKDKRVYCFAVAVEQSIIKSFKQKTDEKPLLLDVGVVVNTRAYKLLYNIPYLVLMAKARLEYPDHNYTEISYNSYRGE